MTPVLTQGSAILSATRPGKEQIWLPPYPFGCVRLISTQYMFILQTNPFVVINPYYYELLRTWKHYNTSKNMHMKYILWSDLARSKFRRYRGSHLETRYGICLRREIALGPKYWSTEVKLSDRELCFWSQYLFKRIIMFLQQGFRVIITIIFYTNNNNSNAIFKLLQFTNCRKIGNYTNRQLSETY